MPAIRSIELLGDRIRVIKGNGQEIIMLIADLPIKPNTTAEQASLFATEYLQKSFESSWLLTDPSWEDADDRIHLSVPVLLPNERIEKVTGKDTYIIVDTFAAVHVYSLFPIVYTTRFSNPECGYKVCPDCGLINSGTAWIELPLRLVDSVNVCSCSYDLTSVPFIGGIGGEWWP